MTKLLARLEALENFLTLKFPSWQDDLARHLEQQSDEYLFNWTLQPSKNATLSNGQLTLTKTGGSRSGWDCNVLSNVGWTSGTHEWSCRLESACDMMVGVAPATTNPLGSNWSSCGFYIGTASGALFGQDGTWKRPYLRERCNRKGSVINVRLDCDRRCVWFGVNGEYPSEPAFVNLPSNVPLHASFDVDEKGSCFTVDYARFRPLRSKKSYHSLEGDIS